MARVLLIDDDQSNLDFMRQVMRIDGHELAWAADGKQGLERAGQFRPQLVICDVVMPHLGGYAVLETLRAEPQFADVPVLLFSAAMNDEARALGLKRGATEVLAKPFDLEQLRGAIRRCLGQET
ncbi:MAG: response regulator [Burkholderiales bacterium]|nr:response regulator [Burkholderiales bacterium]